MASFSAGIEAWNGIPVCTATVLNKSTEDCLGFFSAGNAA